MPEDMLRTYGRRKGRRLSPYRERLFSELLPALKLRPASERPTSLNAFFANDPKDIWLEIGFGNGEHLLVQAEQHLDVGLIGCEPFINGVATVLTQIDQKGLTNIRLFDDDVRLLLDWLPAASLSRVFVLFPDPWPKKRHHKRRLISHSFLDQLSRVMKCGAELRFASDIGDNVRSTLLAINAHRAFFWTDEGPSDWRMRREDWPQTRYEQKALRAGRTPAYLTFRRIDVSDC